MSVEDFARKRLLKVADKVGKVKIGKLQPLEYDYQVKAVNTSINIFKLIFITGESLVMGWFFMIYIPKTKGLGYEPSIVSILLTIMLLLLFGRVKTKSI